MELEENKALREYGIYKALMKAGVVDKKKNVIVEFKDGRNAILPWGFKEHQPIPRIKEVERITIFLDGEEYEFVACQ